MVQTADETYTPFKRRAIARRERAAAKQATLLGMAAPLPSDANTLERTRITLALSRAQMLSLVGAKEEQRGLFHMSDADIAKAYNDLGVSGTCAELLQLYQEWETAVVGQLEDMRMYNSREVARLLDISEMHLYQLIVRGIVVPAMSSRRSHIFDKASIMMSFQRGQDYVRVDPQGRTKGPFANSFIRWLRAHGYAPAERASAHDGYILDKLTDNG